MAKNKSKNINKPKNWEEVISTFQEYLWAQGKAEETISAYSNDLQRFGNYCTEILNKSSHQISRLKDSDLQDFINYMDTEKYAAASAINRAIAALRMFSYLIIENGWHRQNIARDLKTIPLAPPKEPEQLSLKEIKKMSASIKTNSYNGKRDYAIFQILLQCGLRLNELCRLLIRDVQLDGPKSHIKIQGSRDGIERSVPLNTTAKRALNQYLDARGETIGEEPLFLSNQNKPISQKTVQYLVKKHFCAIDRPELSVNNLRQHYAMQLFDKSSGDLSAVQQLMGHRNILTTAKYVKKSNRDMSGTLEKIGQETAI